MAALLPDGATVFLATAYSATIVVGAVSNANPAVATATAHGLANGAFVETTSGWNLLNGRIWRVSGVTANTFNLEGVDTTDVTQYPSGSGAGSVRSITTQTQITQVMDFQVSGGDQQFTSFAFLEDNFERRLPTIFSASDIKLMTADDPLLPGQIALAAAGAARAVRGVRMRLANGSILWFSGTVTFNATPTLGKGQVMQVTTSVALNGLVVRYAT